MTSASAPLRTNRPQWLALHSFVYRLLIGSVVGLFAAVWVFFSSVDYTAFQLAIVGVFLVMFAGVPWMLARMSEPRPLSSKTSFSEWREGDLTIHTGALPAGEAALMIMIAPAACLIGIVAISGVAYLAAIGAI
jgi:hypothetical protein